jgi:hypothetical protein
VITAHRYGFFPFSGFREQWALHAPFGQNVVGVLFPKQVPAFMPGDDLLSSGRHVSEFESSALVGDDVVRMRDHHHFRIHPDVASVAAQVHQAGRRHGARRHAVYEGKRQIESRCTVHVNGVQGRIGTHHVERAILGDQQNMRDVVAALLVEVTPLLRQFQRFAAGSVL